MGITPARYDLRIPQRATLSQEFTLPFDCSEKTVVGQVWNDRRSRLLLQLTTVWIDRAEEIPDTDPVEYKGRFRLEADWQLTRLVKSAGQWDLLVIDDQSGRRDYYLEGAAVLDPGYTEGTV